MLPEVWEKGKALALVHQTENKSFWKVYIIYFVALYVPRIYGILVQSADAPSNNYLHGITDSRQRTFA